MESIRVDLIDHPIDAAELRRSVFDAGASGAVAIFEGVTRLEADPEHGNLVRLEYDAYRDMARKELNELAVRAGRQWRLNAVAVVHRVGPVLPGESSVIIVVSSGHRAAALDACRWLIDTLKQTVPIWKREVYADGFARWVQPASCAIDKPGQDNPAGDALMGLRRAETQI
jgi:molybdopterin synthase catalytic subunit